MSTFDKHCNLLHKLSMLRRDLGLLEIELALSAAQLAEK